jgi:hypothetical protein
MERNLIKVARLSQGGWMIQGVFRVRNGPKYFAAHMGLFSATTEKLS